jgi:hypothetical protein
VVAAPVAARCCHLMLSARPADLPVEATHPARHCLVGLGRLSGRKLPTAPGVTGPPTWEYS